MESTFCHARGRRDRRPLVQREVKPSTPQPNEINRVCNSTGEVDIHWRCSARSFSRLPVLRSNSHPRGLGYECKDQPVRHSPSDRPAWPSFASQRWALVLLFSSRRVNNIRSTFAASAGRRPRLAPWQRPPDGAVQRLFPQPGRPRGQDLWRVLAPSATAVPSSDGCYQGPSGGCCSSTSVSR